MVKKINLQMFADAADGAASTDAAATTATAVDTNTADNGGTQAKAAEKKYTDDDVNKLLDKKFAEWQKKKDKEVEEAKAKEKEAAKLKAMSENEKKDYQLKQYEERIAEFERKETLAEMTKTARNLLAENNITVSDELLSMLVTTDAEQTKAAVDSFTKLYNEAVETKVKERLKGETPKTGTGTSTPMSEIDKRLKKYE